MFKKIIIGMAMVTVSLLSTTIVAENAVTADPAHYSVEFENDKVRIIRIKYGPGEKSVMHTHGQNASIILIQGTMRMTLPDGKSEDVSFEVGDASWTDAEKHLPENIGNGPIEVVLIKLKD